MGRCGGERRAGDEDELRRLQTEVAELTGKLDMAEAEGHETREALLMRKEELKKVRARALMALRPCVCVCLSRLLAVSARLRAGSRLTQALCRVRRARRSSGP